MGKVVDVLDVIVGLVLALRLLARLPGVDALQDAQPPAHALSQFTWCRLLALCRGIEVQQCKGPT